MRRARACSVLLCVLSLSGHADVILSGAGATFPYPLYRAWFTAYENRQRVRIGYQAVGSGGGIAQLRDRLVDFGATDAFLTDNEMEEFGADVLHIPTCLGAVAVTCNLPGAPALQFTPDLIAGIFMGRITRWSDPRIKRINPTAVLPDQEIAVLHRSESSGTTAIFTRYLCQVSPAWSRLVGCGKKVRWPAGMGVEGNPGIASMAGRITGSIGYVELTYAVTHGLACASIRNEKGEFVAPTPSSVSAAASVELPQDVRCTLTNTAISGAYPISAFTYVIVYREQAYGDRTRATAEAVGDLLWWMVHEGQRHTRRLHYAPLPRPAVKRAEAIVRSMTYQGGPIGQP